MLKLFIVDDEKNVRDGLKIILEWEKLGYEVCGEAANGLEGMAKLEELSPDLVIADIKMPGIDGLEMAREFKRRRPECRIIVLTGYSEFQYARQSIELGVDAYLLKPIDEEELLEKVTGLREEIRHEKRMKGFMDASIRLSRDKILERLATGQVDEEFMIQANTLYGLKLPWKTYQVLLVDTAGGAPLDRGVRQRMREAMEEFVRREDCGYVFESEGKIGILVRDFPSGIHARPLEALMAAVEANTGLRPVIAVGGCVAAEEEIHTSYQHAGRLIENKFILGSGGIFTDGSGLQNDAGEKFGDADTAEVIERLYIAVDVNHRENIEKMIEGLGKSFSTGAFTETEIKSFFIKISNAVMSRLAAGNEGIRSLELESEILNGRSLEELKQLLTARLAGLSDRLSQQRPDAPIKKILDYIGRNYSQDIKMETLAQVFGYNSTYLGQLFKNYTGKYFNAYLESIRMEKAMQFLKEGMKVHQAAEKVGYKNLDYFGSKFKKYAGVSPSEYRGDRQ